MKALDWLSQIRGLDNALIEHMGLREREHPQIGTVVEFPYLRNGKPYAGKFRAIDKKDWRSTLEVSRGLFNEDCLNLEGPVVLTEGEMDALSCIQAGFTKSVSLPDGWNENGDRRQCLLDEKERLKQSEFVIVAGDNDAAGKSLPKAVASILAGHDVRYALWPEDCKDANDVLVKYGEGELARCLNEAKRIDPEGGFITGISDLPPLPNRRVLRVNSYPYDKVLAFEIGALSVGTGIPGFGKSTFSTFCAHKIAMTEKVRVGFLSFETHPHQQRDHLSRLHTGKPWESLSEQSQKELTETLDRHFRFVHRSFDEVPAHHLGWLKDMIYTLAVRDNCKLIIVDPWNELEHLPEPGESMTNYINFALQQMRTWASQFGCHIMLIAHPKKINSEGKPRCPTGYDVADSAAFANKPALGFTVHQDRDENGSDFVRIVTWKVRDTQFYRCQKGAIRLEFRGDTMSYHEYQPIGMEQAA